MHHSAKSPLGARGGEVRVHASWQRRHLPQIGSPWGNDDDDDDFVFVRVACANFVHVAMSKGARKVGEAEGGELLLDTALQVAEQVETEDVIVS